MTDFRHLYYITCQVNKQTYNPTNTPRVFDAETTWKQTFPRRFNLEYMWCVCREDNIPRNISQALSKFDKT